ncbi:MAG: hypothetical protein JWQ09_3550 [Segetibacter sp.]|nr:hypothetical protein [Segetibacter sp.]
MNKKLFTLVFFTLSATLLFSQVTRSTTDVQQIWLGYFNQARLTNKFGVWTDLHLRTKEDFTNNFSQSIARIGLTYYLTDNTKLTAGYAYVANYAAEGHTKITQPEHRLWQQVQWHTKYGKTRMMQWIRLEEKYRHKILNDSALADGYNFNYKLRYNLWYEIPFSQKPTNKFSFVINDEVHINFGKQVIYNYFDQNRFFVGLKLNTNKHDNVQLGYMNQFQQLAAGNKYRNNQVIRLFYFQNLDWRKTKG